MASAGELHMRPRRAVFFDRDGVINEVVYHRDVGIVDSPFTVGQFRLCRGAPRAIEKVNRLGLLAVVVSNQPGVGKGHFTRAMLDGMTEKMRRGVARAGARLDGVYYCLHHPQAARALYRKRCVCRKPGPGLLRQAARELHIDLAHSFMVGDSITDIQAGRRAGCRTILIGTPKCDRCTFMQAKKIKPDFIASDILDAVKIMEKLCSDADERR